MDAPPIRYAHVGDDRVAYQVLGDGPALVYCSGSWSHADLRWQHPLSVALMERIASFSRLMVFDRRGSGISDPLPADEMASWEHGAEDLIAVLDAESIDQAVVWGWADAGPLVLLTAASHPERVKSLILVNTTARFLEAPGYPPGMPAPQAESVIKLISETWGSEDFVRMLNPSLAENHDWVRWNAMYQRAAASPAVAARHMKAVLELDLRPVAPLVRCPTLVISLSDLQLLPPEHGRWLAETIPDARFVLIEGDPGALWGDARITDTAEEFVTGTKGRVDSNRVLATVLFTDVASSTTRAAEMGDRKWSQVLDRHDDLARRSVETFGGRLVKTTGDGVLATFDGPARAIRCGLSLSEEMHAIGIDVRTGIHSGEIELRGADVGGIGVHIASRVLGHASPGEVLVSRTVKDLVMGSSVSFTERGAHTLKGIPGDWELFAVARA